MFQAVFSVKLKISYCTSAACSSFRGAMALDTVPEFSIRSKHLGLSEYMDKFDATGATTFGMFPFAANYSPNWVDDPAFDPILGSDTHPKKVALRRLLSLLNGNGRDAKKSRSKSFGSGPPTADFGR